MTVIYYRKKFFKTLFFGDGSILGAEIEKSLEMVPQNGNFDQKLFKQMQNIFWVVQSKIQEKYRKEIQQKLTDMKTVSQKSKKNRFNYYEDYDDYADYKNYSHTDSSNYYDYYDNFNENYIGKINNEYIGNNKNYLEYSSNYDQDYENAKKPYSYYEYNSNKNSYNRNKQKNSYYGGNKEKLSSEGLTDVQIENAVVVNNNIADNKNNEEVNKNEPAIVQTNPNNKFSDDVEIISTVVNNNQNKPTQKNNIQSYYNDNFFKNYVYYYDKYSNSNPNTTSNASQVTASNTVTPVKKNKSKQKKEKKRTTSTEENNNKANNEKNKNINQKNIKNQVEEPFVIVEEKITQVTTISLPPQEVPTVSNNTVYNNFVNIIEPPEIINVQINNNKKSQYNYAKTNSNYKYNNNYYNSNYNNYNQNYQYNYYSNNYSKTNYYYNNYNNSNVAYNSAGYYESNSNSNTNVAVVETIYNPNNITKTYKNESENALDSVYTMGINNNNNIIINSNNLNDMNLLNYRKQSQTNQSTNNSRKNKNNNYAYQNSNYKYNKQLKHEFIDFEEINKNNNINNLNNNITNPKEEVEINIKKEENLIIEKKELVDIDIEKMFEMNVEEEKTAVKQNSTQNLEIQLNISDNNKQIELNSNLKLKFNNIDNPNEEAPNQINAKGEYDKGEYSEEGDEGLEGDREVDDALEVNEEEEGDEESDSVENELIEAEFDKFIMESNMIGINKNYNEDNYYVDFEENTKNNKIIFEDDNDNKISNINIQNITPQNRNNNIESIDINVEVKENSNNTDIEEKVILKETTRNFMESLKGIDPKVLLEIKNKLNEEGKKLESEFNQDNKMNIANYSNNIGQTGPYIEDYFYNQRQYNNNANSKLPIQNYVFSNYAHFFYRGRDSNIHREYFALKCLEQENNNIVTKNIDSFENKILIPIYQRINFNVNKKRGIYFYTFTKYKKLIYRVLAKDKILKKVKPYGSYMNNFLIDSGDIDICIVPKCGILEFTNYLDRIKEEIILQVQIILIFRISESIN
jgi:hypothetical protein